MGTFFRDPAQKYRGSIDKTNHAFEFSRYSVTSSGSISFKGQYYLEDQTVVADITAKNGLGAVVMSSAIILGLFMFADVGVKMIPGLFLIVALIYLFFCLIPFNYGVSEADEEFKHYFFRQIKKTDNITPKKYNF